jgi:hypothetical protein
MNVGAAFEIIVNGVPRTYRNVRKIAIEAAVFHKQRWPTEDVAGDLREGTGGDYRL